MLVMNKVIGWVLLLGPYVLFLVATVQAGRAQTDAGLNANMAFQALMLMIAAIFLLIATRIKPK